MVTVAFSFTLTASSLLVLNSSLTVTTTAKKKQNYCAILMSYHAVYRHMGGLNLTLFAFADENQHYQATFQN